MITLEMVEKLCEKANVSYDEARTALEKSGGDLLEAIIDLERQGKVSAPYKGGFYSSNGSANRAQENETAQEERSNSQQRHSQNFSKQSNKFFAMCGRILEKGNNNYLDAVKDGKRVATLPLTAFALLLIFAFWIIIPICIISLFFGYSYSFRGKDMGIEQVNAAMEKAAQAAENIKKEMTQG